MPGPASARSSRVIVAAVVLLVLAAVALRWLARDGTPDAGDELAAVDTPAPAALAAPPRGDGLDLPPFDPAAGLSSKESDADAARYAPGSWDGVDFEEIRRALPDNLYWEMAVPTTDPEVLRRRQEERDRWNREWGKIQSNTATAEEIDRYYAERQQLHEDYLEFLLHLQKHYAAAIPERDVGALKLAGEMHVARLEEIPRRIAEAHERRAAAEVARQQWREQQKAFGEAGANGDAPAD